MLTLQMLAEVDWQPGDRADSPVPEDQPDDEDIGPGDTVIELRPDDDGTLIPHLSAQTAAGPPPAADPDGE